MSRCLRRAGGLFITLALMLLIMPVRADAPAPHVLYVPAGDTQPSEALRAWLERRGIGVTV